MKTEQHYTIGQLCHIFDLGGVRIGLEIGLEPLNTDCVNTIYTELP